MRLIEFETNLDHGFQGLSYKCDVFLDANGIDAPTGRSRIKKWGSLYQAYDSIKDFRGGSETESPERCVGIIEEVMQMAGAYLSKLEEFAKKSPVYTNKQGEREIRRTGIVYQRILERFLALKQEGISDRLHRKLLEMMEYQLKYYRSIISKVLDPMAASRRVLSKENYEFWPDVEALYNAFMGNKDLLFVPIEREEKADIPLVCLATINAIRARDSTILSSDMGVSNVVEDVFCFVRDDEIEGLDGETELLLKAERKVKVYRIGNKGDALESTNTEGIVLGSKSIDTRRRLREEAQRAREQSKPKEPKHEIDQKFWDSL